MKRNHQRNQQQYRTRRRQRLLPWLLILITLLAYSGYCLIRPIAPAVATLTDTDLTSKKVSPRLVWPEGAESAIGTYASGLLATSSEKQSPLPTASVAKLITALTVLKKYPLAIDQTGPVIELGPRDIQLYNDYYVKDGSLVAIKAGEKISEHKALEAMLLPSANNMADSLAIWAYGSLANYRVAAQTLVELLGMHDTTVGIDASGFDPSTTSTPSDLIKLGQTVLANPLLKQIVNEETATVPVAGKIYNVNYLLGYDGIIGIKTGNSDEADGNLLFAANYQLDKDSQVIIIGAVMHAKNLLAAMKAATPLLEQAKKQFTVTQAIKAGSEIATYSAPWLDKPVMITAKRSLEIATFGSQTIPRRIETKTLKAPQLFNTSKSTVIAGASIGELTIGKGSNAKSTDLIASRAIPAPSIFWRLTHPL